MKRLNIKRSAIVFILSLPLILSAGCSLIPDFTIPPPTQPTTPAPSPTPPTPIKPDYTLKPSENGTIVLPSIADVVAEIRPMVVAINTEVITYDIFRRPFTQQGAGSGWIIDEDGLIVTNNHVVEGAKTVTVTLSDDNTYTAESVHTDPFSDLAIVRINASNLPVARVGDSTKLRVGDWVVAIGNALGRGISAKEGIISRTGVSIDVSEGQTLSDLLETSAAINPGNSGGPLVNMTGEVIGITSAKLAAVGIEGMGYAISSHTAKPIIEELIQKGYVTRPWLGVGLSTVSDWLVLRYDLNVEKGAFITEMVRGSPADKAGLKAGDVVVDMDGTEIASADDMIRTIHASGIGKAVNITLWRGKEKITAIATLTESPAP